MATINQQPVKILADLILGDAALLAKLGQDSDGNALAGPGMIHEANAFPVLSWRFLTSRAMTELGLEIGQYGNWIIQVDVYGPDEYVLQDIQGDIDDLLAPASHFGNAIDSANWRVIALYLEGGWRTLDWQDRLTTQDGRNIVQKTADFRYRFVRRQDV